LRPFEFREHDRFFGREKQIGEIIDRLRHQHFAAILGGSGCGKSSLVRAGVIPELQRYGIHERGDFWLAAAFTPGTEPIRNLAKSLDALLVPLPNRSQHAKRISEIEDELSEAGGFSAFIERFRDQIQVDTEGLDALRSRANLLVLADQFEEVFRPENERNPQVRQLVDLIVDAHKRPREGVYIVLTMRTEDLHKCAAFMDLPEVLNAASYMTRRLNEDELALAILRPAKRFCPTAPVLAPGAAAISQLSTDDPWPFELIVMKRLFDGVARESADSDHLPLLQHLLLRLWEKAQERWRKECVKATPSAQQPLFLISAEDLEAAIGKERPDIESILRRSLANHAEELYQSFSSDKHQRIAEIMFRLLGEVDENGVHKRRWTTREEITSVAARLGSVDGDTVNEVIQTFSEPHRFIRGTPEGKLDVSHEAFIRNWPTLKN
jgi:hypothetical protein